MALWVASSSCAPPPVDVALALTIAAADVSATLKVVDADDTPVSFDVALDGEVFRATGEAPVRCDSEFAAAECSFALRIEPGAYRFVLDIVERDRCGVPAKTMSLSSGDDPIEVLRGIDNDVLLAIDKTDFDDDGDGIVNALERTVCGRFDVVDDALPPQQCLMPDDPCCARPLSNLQGQRSVFAGGAHARADGVVVDLGPFALDATETTWATLARCVAAGACLYGLPEHTARVRLADATLPPDAPVTGLLPREAEALCVWRGGRLPDDDEWDFAAAHRDDGMRGRYPFDLLEGVDTVECLETAGGAPAANHAARTRDCPDGPLPVGSYPSTHVTRGLGSALADLAGNVAEWTVRRGDPSGPAAFPDGVVEVAARGGAAGGIVELLENDFALRVGPAAPDVEARLAGLSASTGVRCAFDVDAFADLAAAAARIEEPVCGEP
jgi:hypothetical protein